MKIHCINQDNFYGYTVCGLDAYNKDLYFLYKNKFIEHYLNPTYDSKYYSTYEFCQKCANTDEFQLLLLSEL